MSNNLNIGRVPDGVESPEVLLNAALEAIDALLSEALEVDLSTGNQNVTLAQAQRSNFISLNGAGTARTVTLPAIKRTLFLKNFGSSEVTLQRGTKSIAVPAGQARTVRLLGSENGLEDIGGGGSGGGGEGSTGLPEAPNDGKQYGRQNQAWTEIVASEGGGGGGGGEGATVPEYKIWRITVTQVRNEGQNFGISRLRAYTADGADITSQITNLAASSTFSDSSLAGLLDNDPLTYWRSDAVASDATPQWIDITFANPVAVAYFGLSIQDNWYERFPSKGTISGRNTQGVIGDITNQFDNGRSAPVVSNTIVPFYTFIRYFTGIAEAPKDGNFYARKDGAWIAVNVTPL